jgi:hypothetical protein
VTPRADATICAAGARMCARAHLSKAATINHFLTNREMVMSSITVLDAQSARRQFRLSAILLIAMMGAAFIAGFSIPVTKNYSGAAIGSEGQPGFGRLLSVQE